jgi:hypothetical protein
LRLIVRTLLRLSQPKFGTRAASHGPEIVRLESLGKRLTSNWRPFKSPLTELEIVNTAARWNYQRDRVFVRSGVAKRKTIKRSATHRPVKKAESLVVFKPPISCPKCGKRGRRKAHLRSRTVQDLIFGRGSVKGRSVKYAFQTYFCRSCAHEYNVHEWYLKHQRRWGWNIVAYFVYHVAGLCIPQSTIMKSMNRLYGFTLSPGTMHDFKCQAAQYYAVTKRKILDRLIHGTLIHADETHANIKGHLAYVWVLTNLKEVVYILADSRDGEMIRNLLREFSGVLVSDFFTAYDAISSPQQKCLIHLMRDLNDEILNKPFDTEMKEIAVGFAGLLKPMVDTIDQRGLRKRYLRKHLARVRRFYEFLDTSHFTPAVTNIPTSSQTFPHGRGRRLKTSKERNRGRGHVLGGARAVTMGIWAWASHSWVRAFVRERLSPQKTPTFWIGVDEWPLTGSGEIKKFALREAFQNGEDLVLTA